MYKKSIVFAILLLNGINVFAQKKEKVFLDSIKNIELPASVIITSKTKKSIEKSVSQIDKKTIERLNVAQDLPYILNSISSVVSSSDAGAGIGYTNIRIRGADLTRINVTMNGVPVNDAESQTTYFVNTPDLLSSSQQIDVSKGVGNSKNGTGNFGAGIAINNLDVNYEKPILMYQTDFGSFQTFKNTAKISTGLLHDKIVSTFRLSSVKSNGYIDRASSNLKALQWTTKYEINKNTQLIFNYMKGKEKTGQAWNGVPQDSLQTNRTYNELGIKNDGTFYNNQTDNYGQDYYQLFFDKKLNKKWAIGSTLFYTKGKGYYEEYKTDQAYSEYGLQDFVVKDSVFSNTDVVRQLWLNNDFYGGRIYTTYQTKKLDAGVYINYNQYKAKHYGDIIWATQGIEKDYRWYQLTAQKNDANMYAMLDYKPVSRISIFADMQYRNVHYITNGFRKNPTIYHNLVYHFFNPKIKFTYKDNHQITSLLVGIAQKEPNRDDIEAGKNSIPKPEKLLNAELNYIYILHKQMHLHANIYGMFYKDQLVLTGKINDVGAYTRSNIDKSYRAGIELEMFYKSNNNMWEVNMNMAFSKNKIILFNEFIDDYDNGTQTIYSYKNTDISFSPNVILGGRVSFFPCIKNNASMFKNFSLDFLPKYVGKQYLDNTTNENRMIQSYFVSDILLNMPIEILENKKLNIRAGVYNIFNKKYEANGYTFSYIYNNMQTTQNYFYPQAGMHVMLGVGLSL